jgi:hypothetical protein
MPHFPATFSPPCPVALLLPLLPSLLPATDWRLGNKLIALDLNAISCVKNRVPAIKINVISSSSGGGSGRIDTSKTNKMMFH